MKIFIIDYEANNKKVYFSSEYGRAFGYWKENHLFQYNCFVEFNIPQIIFSKDIKISDSSKPSICAINDNVIINGFFTIDGESSATFLFGGSLILIELSNDDFSKFNNKYVLLTFNVLELYDEGLN